MLLSYCLGSPVQSSRAQSPSSDSVPTSLYVPTWNMKHRLKRQREQEWRREQQRELHHFRHVGEGVGFVDSAREKNKARAVAEIYLEPGVVPTAGLHPSDTTKIPLLTATWRVPRTHGVRLVGTSTAVPRPSCKLEAGHHRGSWR